MISLGVLIIGFYCQEQGFSFKNKKDNLKDASPDFLDGRLLRLCVITKTFEF